MEKTRVFLATKYPFYAAMLNQCVFKWSKQVPTAGVRINLAGNAELAVNKEFFYGLDEHARVGLLIHEMLHLSMKHITRAKGLEPRRANVAMDIAINQYIPKEMLPPGALLPNQFQLAPGKAFEHYYAELSKREPPKQQPLDDHNWDQPAENNGEQAEGQQPPNQPNQSDTSESAGKSQGAGESVSKAANLSDEIKNAIVDSMVGKATKEAEDIEPGSTPMPIQAEIDAALAQRRSINWKQRLRSYLGQHYNSERESTRNRPNRRLGFGAPGSKRIEAPKILIGVDESGSVSNEQLAIALSELKWILDSIQERTEVVYFDTEIARVEKLSKLSAMPERYASGGTSFQCVVDHAAKTRPDLIIMLTDGEAPMPRDCKCPILWALVGDADTNELKGTKIKIG